MIHKQKIKTRNKTRTDLFHIPIEQSRFLAQLIRFDKSA